MGRFSNSVALAKSSWAVLKMDRELMVIPVVSFIATLITTALMGTAVFISLKEQAPAKVSANLQPIVGDATFSGTTLGPTPVTYVLGFVGYLLVTFIVTFFAAALVAGAHQRLTGGNPTLGSAFGVAGGRLGPIVLWSLLTGTVGFVLSSLESRTGVFGQIAVRLIGTAWRVVTWLAVPVIVVEGTGPLDSLKRAGSLFKRTWGENLIAQGGLGVLSFLVMAAGLVVAGAIFTVVPVAGIILFIVWVAVASTVIATLNGIYRTALYLYASGQPVAWFDEEVLAGAFRPRTGVLS